MGTLANILDNGGTRIMTIDGLIESVGGLGAMCQLLGWQGGTIHQARAEFKRRLGLVGIVENRDGELVTIVVAPTIAQDNV